VTRKHAEIADHVEPGGRDGRAKSDQQIVGLEPEGARAVLPKVLERQFEAAIGAPIEALLRERGSHGVSTEPLELRSIAAVDPLLGVDVDTEGLGHGLG
jgi:hypothetical protein